MGVNQKEEEGQQMGQKSGIAISCAWKSYPLVSRCLQPSQKSVDHTMTCPARVSSASVLQKCQVIKNVLQGCQVRVPYKSVR